MRGLSVRKSATVAELKSVVSNLEAQITGINAVVKAQNNESLLEDRISVLQDKIVQLENSSKANYQALSAQVAELELENDNIKTENNKLKNEIKNLKGKLKSVEQSFNDKLNNPRVQEDGQRPDQPADQALDKGVFTFPTDIPVSNSFSILQEIPQVVDTTSSTPDVASDELRERSHRSGNTSNSNNSSMPPSVRLLENEVPTAGTDDIILLIDSNGKQINTDQFTSNK